jgi:hypothetical protein
MSINGQGSLGDCQSEELCMGGRRLEGSHKQEVVGGIHILLSPSGSSTATEKGGSPVTVHTVHTIAFCNQTVPPVSPRQ